MTSHDELDRRLAEIEARERELERRERIVETKSIRHNLYDRINLSVGTVNAIIIVCAVLIVTLVVLGAVWGQDG